MNYKGIISLMINQIEAAISDPAVSVINNYQNFTPDLREPWIRVTLIPSESRNVSTGKDSIIEHTGLFQMDIFTPKGTDVSFTYVDAIVKAFNEERSISDVSVEVTLDRTWKGVDVIPEESDWIRTPVLSRFRYYQYSVSIND